MAKTAAKGAALKLGDGGSPESFATVAYITQISLPLAKPDFIDVTTHDSPNFYEEVVAGIIRTGECAFRGFYDSSNATHNASTGLTSVINTLKNWQLVFTDSGAAQFAFAGYVMITLNANVDGANEIEGSIRITGAITES